MNIGLRITRILLIIVIGILVFSLPIFPLWVPFILEAFSYLISVTFCYCLFTYYRLVFIFIESANYHCFIYCVFFSVLLSSYNYCYSKYWTINCSLSFVIAKLSKTYCFYQQQLLLQQLFKEQ